MNIRIVTAGQSTRSFETFLNFLGNCGQNAGELKAQSVIQQERGIFQIFIGDESRELANFVKLVHSKGAGSLLIRTTFDLAQQNDSNSHGNIDLTILKVAEQSHR